MLCQQHGKHFLLDSFCSATVTFKWHLTVLVLSSCLVEREHGVQAGLRVSEVTDLLGLCSSKLRLRLSEQILQVYQRFLNNSSYLELLLKSFQKTTWPLTCHREEKNLGKAWWAHETT